MSDAKDTRAEPGGSSPKAPRSAEGALVERSVLETVGLVAGVLGVTALIFAVVLYAIDPDVLGLAILNTCVAVVALVFYATTNRNSIGRAFAGRSTAFVLLEALVVLGVLGAAGAANYFAAKSTKEWDLTRDQLYTLTDQSAKVAARLQRPVKVLGFFKSSDRVRGRLLELVELYRRHTARLEVEIINPDTAPPALVKQLGLSASSPRIVVVAEGGRSTKLKAPTEELLTNALLKLAERPPRKVYFLRGHGEPSLDDHKTEAGYHRIAADLRDEGYEVAALSLAEAEEMPSDASALVLAAPRSALFPNELRALSQWLERGGRLLALLEPGTDPGLGPLLGAWGVVVGDDLVVDPNPAARAFGFGADTAVVQRFEAHPITDPLREVAAVFQAARSVSPKLGQGGAKVVTLVQSSKESWGESRWKEGAIEKDEGDLLGPVPLAIAASKDTFTVERKASDQARLVVFGDASFASNRFAPMSGDGDLFLNVVSWLVGDEERITIRPKARGASTLLLTETQQYDIMFFSVNLLPLLVIGFGFSVWAVRRRK